MINNSHVVSIAPTMTVHDFITTTFQLFNLSPQQHDQQQQQQQQQSSTTTPPSSSLMMEVMKSLEFYSGFPPKILNLPKEEAMIKNSFIKAYIQSGDNVMVKFIIHSHNKGDTKKTKKRKQPTATKDNTIDDERIDEGGKRPNRRKAAKVALESFKDVIKQQDKLIKQERQERTTRTTTRSKNSNDQKRSAAAESRAAAASTNANARRLEKLPGGRRLNDETNDTTITTKATNKMTTSSASASANSNAIATIKTKKVQSVFHDMSSEEDISVALLSSIGSGSGKKVSKLLRMAMKGTVEKSYEASKAVVRCSAVTSGNITFQAIIKSNNSYHNHNYNHTKTAACQILGGGQDKCNDIGTYTVRYPKGVEGTGYFEDANIHVLSIDMLKAVIESVYNADLKDEGSGEEGGGDNHDIAESGREMLRPRNMAQLSPRVLWSLWFHFKDKCASIEDVFTILLPHLDWSFLSRRSRQLSEKARENLRQKQQTHQGVNRGKKKIINEEDEYIARVEAVKSVEVAMENMYSNNDAVSFLREKAARAALDRLSKVQTDCKAKWIVETPTEQDEDELRECITEAMDIGNKYLSPDKVEELVQSLLSKCSIRNWRMLANSNVDDILQASNLPNIVESFLANAITFAQERSMEEIMLGILDGKEEIYHLLREKASSATPLDITLWKLSPSTLLEEVPELQKGEYAVTEYDISDWCYKAEIALGVMPWLELFSTSIMQS